MSSKKTRSLKGFWTTMLACFGLGFLACVPALAAGNGEANDAAARPCDNSPTAKPKKRKGLGLGGLLGAAQQAGVGRLLGGGMGGSGGKGQIASAVLGTAMEAAANSTRKDAEAQAATNEAAQGTGTCPASPAEAAPRN